jgi:aminopeptidase N
MRRTIYLAQKCVFFFLLLILNFGDVVRQTNCQSSGIRLSTDVTPTNYDIHLRVDVEKREFNGSETIYVNVHESTDLIEFHMIDLRIEKLNIFDDENNEFLLLQST